jgi:cellulose synthase operon protein C
MIRRFPAPVILWLAAAWVSLCSAQDNPAPAGLIDADSTFWSLTIQELQDYRKYTLRQIDALHGEKKALIRRGIETGERLLAEKSRSKYLDDIFIRLADLTYLEEHDAYLDSMKAYEDRQAGTGVRQGTEPKPDFGRSMALYQRIRDEFPTSEFVDDALYNQGFLYEESGDHAAANRVFEQLIEQHPDSRFAVEACMRLAEYYFNPPQNDLEKAISYYAKVTARPANPRYTEALYKLGWSHYRLGRLPSAISYFTTLIEAVEGRGGTPGEPAPSTDLRDEAVEYIAVCFMDFGGPGAASEYLRKIGNPAWGTALLEKLGRMYMEEKEDYPNAILVYGLILDAQPAYGDAPRIQMRIADCHRMLKDENGAFDARQKLFLLYRTGSAWWDAVPDKKCRNEAGRLCERALRENFLWLIRRAENAGQAQPFYRQAVELGRSYLEYFPDDVNALLVRWNMALVLDTKLQQYKDAFLEYLAISMAYTGEPYDAFAREKGLPSTQDAAENAIVMADSLVLKDRHDHPAAHDSTATAMQEPKAPGNGGEIPVTDSEKWLAIAYDNYIKLFPYSPKTQPMLVNAGILYYSHRNFVEALKYFKTLVKNFPDSPHSEEVYFSVIDSYFGNQDYVSAEIYCRKLLQDPGTRSFRERLTVRLGEAIFRSAQELAARNRSRDAGDEYVRMALETPKVDFADRALFNAGREYDKAKGLDSAIRAYEMLRASCPGSKYLADALTNMAFDYGEKGDFLKCGIRYEELYGLLNEGPKARDALYNALFFFTKAEDWAKTVELGVVYAFRYPDAEDAPLIYFQTAENCRRIGDLRGTTEIYARLPRAFPRSPLGVESLFRLGKYCLEKDSLGEAEKRFIEAVQKHDSLAAAGLTGNPNAAAEALFQACVLQQKQFDAIAFRLPDTEMRRAMDRKQALAQKLAEQYARIAAFRTPRLPEVLFRIGDVYEGFAGAWAGQEIPPLDPIAKAVKEKTINERTRRIYEEALAAFLGGLRVLDKIRKEATPPQAGRAAGPSGDADSLSAEAGNWSAKIMNEISKVLFLAAEIQTRSIDKLLQAPIPAELSDMARLEYRSQVLVKVIKPLVDGAAEAHRRNLIVADSLSITGAWVDSSRSKIQAVLGLLAGNYEALAWDGVGRYRYWMDLYGRNRENAGALPDEWTDMVINSLELSKSYSEAVILFTKDGVLKSARIGVDPARRVPVQEALVRFALRMADTLGVLIADARENQKQAEALYMKTRNADLENMPSLFADNSALMEKTRTSVLESAYAAEKEFDPPSPSTGWIAVRLIRLDPENAPRRLNVKMESATVPTDTTWMISAQNSVASGGESADGPAWSGAKKNSAAPDSVFLKEGCMRIGGSASDTLRIRYRAQREFDVPGFPVFCGFRFAVNPSVRFFVNGKPAAAGPAIDSGEAAQFFRPGSNRLRLEFEEPGAFWAEGWVRVRYLPENPPAKVDP